MWWRRAPGERRIAASPWATVERESDGRPVIAFVIPWYGVHIPGGAEAECRRTAENLHRRGYPVEVLTTCARQFRSDWGKDYHRPGVYRVNDVVVRRFSLRPRDRQLFHAVNLRLMRNFPVSPSAERQFMAEMINSLDLYRFIAERRDAYYFVFIPYMFSTTYYGSQICPERSFIIPCLHDEGHARMQLLSPVFASVRGLILHSGPELELARQLYELDDHRLHLLGEGVDIDVRADPTAFVLKYGLLEDFILYVGKRDASKNTPLLLEYFARYKERRGGNLKLVLMGSGPIEDAYRRRADVLDLGFVSDADKYGGLAAATVLCQPSVNESFSLVMMEAWVCGRPALVHADCAVTVDHCRRSNAGLWFASYGEFEGCVDFLVNNPDTAQRMGQLGQRYVWRNFRWDAVVERLARVIYG